jgi:hypothetical protein
MTLEVIIDCFVVMEIILIGNYTLLYAWVLHVPSDKRTISCHNRLALEIGCCP